MYRLSGAGHADRAGIWQVIHWDEVIWYVVPCPRKKGDVMARERQNFVYGNEEEGVPGCMANGISEEVANKIFDEMTDFAKYALTSPMQQRMR